MHQRAWADYSRGACRLMDLAPLEVLAVQNRREDNGVPRAIRWRKKSIGSGCRLDAVDASPSGRYGRFQRGRNRLYPRRIEFAGGTGGYKGQYVSPNREKRCPVPAPNHK